MAQPSRSILFKIITNFIESLKPRTTRGEVVGRDQFGNTYYQIAGTSRQKTQRWFDPKESDNFEQEIPAEWESWLRYRRTVPPMEEEVLANANLAKQKKMNAIALEAERLPKKEPLLQDIVKGYESFPVYEEYEIEPGKKTNKK